MPRKKTSDDTLSKDIVDYNELIKQEDSNSSSNKSTTADASDSSDKKTKSSSKTSESLVKKTDKTDGSESSSQAESNQESSAESSKKVTSTTTKVSNSSQISQAAQRVKETEKTYKVDGILEIRPDYGIIRQEKAIEGLPKDVYIATTQINKFGLRKGDRIEGIARSPKEGERYLSLLKVEKVEGIDAEKARNRPRFEDLIAVHPNERLRLETKPEILTTRLMDLLTPIGKGQRAMIVAPPKAGKTWLLQDIARGLAENHPELKLMVVLIGERPEEVTEMQRSVKGDVYASNFDESAAKQVEVAENALERAKRLAEKGEDVVILMDSITRLARAYNLVETPSGRTLTGGFDPAALYPPKKFFGAARNFENAGSLTIIATALVETGSKMDDVIFEEFKGTGNMELFLDRSLAERRIYPAFDIKRSMTRHEELLYTPKEAEKVLTLRRMIDLLDPKEATQVVLERMKKTKSNEEFLDSLANGSV